MKKILSILVSALLLCSVVPVGAITAAAEEFGSITVPVEDLIIDVLEMLDHTVDGDGVTITDCDPSAMGTLKIPDTIEEKPVTAIAASAFEDCTEISAVTIPDSVTFIGEDAFKNTGLYNNEDSWEDGVLYISNHLIAAKDTFTAAYSIREGTLTIASGAFAGCTSLSAVTIPDSVTNIGENAFYNTGYYETEENWVNDVLYIGDYLVNAKTTLGGQYIVRDGVVAIAAKAFADCTNLTSVIIPDSVGSIGSTAFTGCTIQTAHFYSEAQKDKFAALFGAAALSFGPTIVAASANASATAGDSVKFTVDAIGSDITYQWQIKTSSTGSWKDTATSGNKTKTITVSATAARNGYQYRCVVTDKNDVSATSAAVQLTVVSPKITSAPESVSVTEGSKAKFTVAATGNGLTYQWQIKTSSTGSWANTTTSGYKTKTITASATAARNGYQYRCVVTDKNGNKVYSGAAKLTVVSPKITANPKSVSAAKGNTAKFTVGATGNGITYQWQIKTSSTGSWANTSTSGNKTKTITVSATTARNGYQYRCVVTDDNGNKVYSSAAKLTVVSPKITANPKSVSAAKGNTAKFTVKASGVGLKYQWQIKTSSTGSWANTSTSGNKTQTITVSATTARNGYQYRCVVTDAAGNKVYSSAAKLTVVSPKITANPKSVSAAKGNTAKFTVKASGVGLKYQWQIKTSSTGSWKNTTTSGYKTNTITVSATTARNGYQYRCVVTDAAGNKVYSSAAKLTVVSPKITSNPKSVSAAKGNTAKFTVKASGVGLKYQWQVKTSSSASWKNTTYSGCKTATLKVTATTARSGYQFRCVVTDAAGNKVYSKAGKLTVK